jgi:hypothetical protein
MIIITDSFVDEYFDEMKVYLFDQDNGEVTKDYIIELFESCNNGSVNNVRYKQLIPFLYEKYFIAKIRLNVEMSKHFAERKKESELPLDEMVKDLMRMFIQKNEESNLQIRYIKRDTEPYKRHQIYFCKDVNPKTAEVCYYKNDGKDVCNRVPDDENYLLFKISECVRLQFTSAKIMRCIELFSTQYSDFYSLVARFHFACVRGYFQNNTVYLLASSISSFMTGLNIDSKYFTSSKDPAVIFNKYMVRGIGTCCNKTEMMHIIKHNTEKATDNCKINSEEEEDLFCKPKKIDHKIFRPQDTMFTDELDYHPQLSYIENNDNLVNSYQKEYDYYSDKLDLRNPMLNMFNIKHVNEKGYIVPYQPWVKDAYWNLFGKYMNNTKVDKERFKRYL